jgi:methylenetetrahydrofolate--tRNA-(uracil-5-)-methyltransferase
MGALLRHVTGEAHPDGADYQPTNVVYALFPPLAGRHKKIERKARMLDRARSALAAWASANAVALAPAPSEKRWPSELRP